MHLSISSNGKIAGTDVGAAVDAIAELLAYCMQIGLRQFAGVEGSRLRFETLHLVMKLRGAEKMLLVLEFT